jgi:hypothetical protein
MTTNAAQLHVELNPGLPWQSNVQRRKTLFYQQIGIKFEEETSKMLHRMVLKLGHFGQWIEITWIVFKCGAGKGWKISVGPNV